MWRLEGNRVFKYIPNRYKDLISDELCWKELPGKRKRENLIREYHNPPTMGHMGISKTLDRVQRRYYWPKMKADIARFVTRCKVCLGCKIEQKAPAGLLGKHPVAQRPWQIISSDLFSPLPRSSKGYTFILVITDYFSKFSLLFPLRLATAKAISEVTENSVFLLFGVPQVLLCDNGTQYRSKIFQAMLSKYGVKPLFNPAYHAQSNPTERVNGVLKTMLASYVNDNHRSWADYLPKIACALRTTKHDTISVSPYFANFGYEMITDGNAYKTVDLNKPIIAGNRDELEGRSNALQNVHKDIEKRLNLAYTKHANVYNLRRREKEFELGDVVWRRNFVLSDASKYFTAKLAPKYVGPFRIIKKLSRLVYKLDDGSDVTWHIKDLKPNYE